jgi:flagellar FliL protein
MRALRLLNVDEAALPPSSMSTDESTTTDTAPPDLPKSGRRIWLFALIAILLLGGGGAGVYWLKGQAAPAGEQEEEEAAGPSFVAPFEAFVVNLADAGGARFLRVTLSLVVSDHESQESLQEPVTRTRVRSAILELLAQQSSDVLVTPEGKTALKRSIAEHARKAESHLRITDVFFSEFIVQF